MNRNCLFQCVRRSLPVWLIWSIALIVMLILALTGGAITLGTIVITTALVKILAVSGVWAIGVAGIILACYNKNCKGK